MTEEFHDAQLDPLLDPLIRALTADAAPPELAGEDNAVAMFRAQHHLAPARQRRRFIPSMGMAAAAATVVAALAGGAYAAVLPAPIQRIAHRVLAPIGVPQPRTRAAASPGPAPLADRSAAARPPSRPAQRTPAPSSVASSSPIGGSPVLLSAVHVQIPAGSPVTVDGRVAPGGTPRAGVRVQLLELDGSRWRPVAAAVTGANGQVVFVIRHVATNTAFRLADLGARPSSPVEVTVVPKVTVVLSASDLSGADLLTVDARSAEPGDVVVLQIAVTGSWRDIAEQQLDSTRQATFTVAITQGQYYRVMLLATSAHAGAVSPPVHAPRGIRASTRYRHQS
jgi:hypothetical protein